ncbi:MAG: tetratricopeptide repeat protein, partial [Saprospiraceae bacterium]
MAGRTYHNLTAHYNGYFNAQELYNKSEETLTDSHQDNYNQVLEMYKYVPADAKAVDNDMETAIQKVSVVIRLHRKSDWTDDAYLLMGQCRYLQKDYEGAQEALEYLAAEYNMKALDQKKLKRKSKKGQQKAKAKAKKKRQDMKKKGLEEKPEKYPLETRPAYEDGQIWLARTMIERGLYDDAELMMTRMKTDLKTHKDMADEIAEVSAYNWLKQGEYEKAIKPLEEVLELTNKRKKKVRFSYILAQIYQLGGQDEKAYAYFSKVLKSGPTYDMEFNAKLNMTTSSWLAGKESSEEVLKNLRRMLKDSKNKEYKDRIYFTIAKVHLKDKNNVEAIAALQSSLKYSSGNQTQKAESYLLLGDLYYGTEKYVLSKNYFDSTLLAMNDTDSRKERVQRMSSNLTDIAKNIEIITLQDSLLAINDMTPGQRRKLAAKLIKEQEEAKKNQQSAALANAAASAGGSTNLLGASKSLFFAYNDRNTKRGKKAFDKRWGSRNLEDDWRRSAKTGGFDTETEEVSDEQFAETLSDDQITEVFANVPDTPEKIAASNNKIRVAMFELGTLFRDKIQNNNKSIETLEGLLKRYPDTSDKLEVYY